MPEEKRRMGRIQVYNLIEQERDYQNLRHNKTISKHPHRDEDHSVADWLIYIENHLNQAKQSVYNLDLEDAKEQVRKIAALCVACMEYNETKPRYAIEDDITKTCFSCSNYYKIMNGFYVMCQYQRDRNHGLACSRWKEKK